MTAGHYFAAAIAASAAVSLAGFVALAWLRAHEYPEINDGAVRCTGAASLAYRALVAQDHDRATTV